MTLTSDAGGDGQVEPSDEADLATDFFRGVGKQIRLLRERAGLSQRELGQRLGYSYDQIRSVEIGRRTPMPDFLAAADDFLNAGGVLKAVDEDVLNARAHARVRHPAWFRDYARAEAQAVEVNFYSAVTVPGLLQTEDYARTIFTARQPLLDDETIEQRVSARMARQKILSNWPAPMVSAVLDESVLRRAIGGPAVHQGQLRHLLRLAQLRSTSIQVLPVECAEHAGLEGPFILLTPKGEQQVGYVEVQSVSRLITDAEEVRILAARYGTIRGQALTPRESLILIEKMLGEG